jgi:restriction endonuclease Mrr
MSFEQLNVILSPDATAYYKSLSPSEFPGALSSALEMYYQSIKNYNSQDNKIISEIKSLKESLSLPETKILEELKSDRQQMTTILQTIISSSKSQDIQESFQNISQIIDRQNTTIDRMSANTLAHTQSLSMLMSSAINKLDAQHNTGDTILKSVQDISEILKPKSQVSQIKGRIFEDALIDVVCSVASSAEVEITRGQRNSGDLKIKYHDTEPIMVEAKNYTRSVPTKEVEKFYNDLSTNQCHFGIFISTTGIVKKRDRIVLENIDGTLVMFVSHWTLDEAHILKMCIDFMYGISKCQLKESSLLPKTLSQITEILNTHEKVGTEMNKSIKALTNAMALHNENKEYMLKIITMLS